MKKMAAALFLLPAFIALTAKAQLRTALSGGIHTASVPGNTSPGWDTLNYKYGSRTGFHFGIIADMPLSSYSKFNFQTGLLFSNKGRRFSTSYDTAVSSVSKVNAL